MKIKLLKLKIENFKGIDLLKIKFDSDQTLIVGKNGTGKSTIVDAFFWLFDGSNQEGKATFSIIPLADSGNVVDHINPTVEAELEVDGNPLILKKQYRQIWTKKRGAEKAELSSHKTDHFYDEVPVSKKEYEDRLKKLIKPKYFRSISDVHYFCGNAKPDFRRQVLMKLLGKISDEDIIKKYKELADLPALLRGRSLEDFKAICNQNKKAINEQLKRLPGAIEERKHGRPEIDHLNKDELTTQISEIDTAIAAKMQEIAQLSAGSLIAEKRKQKTEFEAEILEIETKIKTKYSGQKMALLQRMEKLQQKLRAANECKNAAPDKLRSIDRQIEENKAARIELGGMWDAVNSEKFDESSNRCYACSQVLPDDKIAEQKQIFNDEKERKFADLDKKGENLLAEKKRLETRKVNVSDELDEIKKEVDRINRDIIEVEADYASIEKELEIAIKEKTLPIKERIVSIDTDLAKDDAGTGDEKRMMERELADLEKMRGIAETDILKIVEAEKIDKRVNYLKEELANAGREYETISYHLHLLELFQRKRSEYIEQNVNDHFEICRWKLFDIQINQGIKEICEATVGAIPYTLDLNTGAKINAGLDVIRTLQKHFGVKMPVFVDNSESITNWIIEPDYQIIKLTAAPNIDELEVING